MQQRFNKQSVNLRTLYKNICSPVGGSSARKIDISGSFVIKPDVSLDLLNQTADSSMLGRIMASPASHRNG